MAGGATDSVRLNAENLTIDAATVVRRVGGTVGKAKLVEALKKETRVTVRSAMTRVLQGERGSR